MALSRKAKSRLTKLADHMDSLPRSANEHFWMCTFFSHNQHHEHQEIPLSGDIGPEALEVCGTSACAAGFAAMVPAFRKLGLRLVAVGGRGEIRFGRVRPHAGDVWRPLRLLFDIDDKQSEYLFGAYPGIKTPKQWARRCRAFIKFHEEAW